MITASLLGLATVAGAAPAAPAFEPAGTIAAPDDRWDFASWDAAHGRLLVAHGGDVLVIDPAHPEAVRAIGALANAHGVLAIPGTGHIIVSSGKDDSVRILDEASGTELARIAVAADPDAIILSADGGTAYVMCAKGGAVSIVDLGKQAEVGRIALKEELEVPVLVTPTLLAVNDEDASEIELADLATRKAAGSIALPGCEGPTGLALDPASGLALSACANGKGALVDLKARKLVALVPIGDGPDTAIWDGAHHRFLVPCGKSGTLSVIRLDGRTPVAGPVVQTEASARTAAYDPASGHLYLPAARFLAPVPPAKRGAMVKGSFHIVVLAPHG
jgi:DNA-binding beta-propeller fold protein YncE